MVSGRGMATENISELLGAMISLSRSARDLAVEARPGTVCRLDELDSSLVSLKVAVDRYDDGVLSWNSGGLEGEVEVLEHLDGPLGGKPLLPPRERSLREGLGRPAGLCRDILWPPWCKVNQATPVNLLPAEPISCRRNTVLSGWWTLPCLRASPTPGNSYSVLLRRGLKNLA